MYLLVCCVKSNYNYENFSIILVIVILFIKEVEVNKEETIKKEVHLKKRLNVVKEYGVQIPV